MPRIPSVSAGRRTLRWAVIAFLLLLALPVLASVLVVVLGVTLSAAPWRDEIGGVISNSLGRGVRLEGPLKLILSLDPILTVGGIRISNPPGFATSEFASLGQAQLQLDLRALLHGRVEIRDMTAENVAVRLEKTASGEANWRFALPRSGKRASGPPSTGLARDLRFEVQRLILRNLAVEYFDGATGTSRYFDLSQLAGEARSGKPVKLELKGTVEKRFPYALTISGGGVEELLRDTSPWPFEVNFDSLGTVLRVNGTVDMRTGTTQFLFGLGSENFAEIERVLQTKLPQVGASALAGHVEWRQNVLKLSGLHATMGQTSLEGDLTLDATGPKPRLTGSLHLPTLDLRPFLSDDAATDRTPPRSFADTYRELEKVAFSLRALQDMDADLALTVGEWLSLPGDVRNAKLGIKLQDGVLAAPVEGTIAGVALSGELDADGTTTVPKVDLRLGTQRSPLGGLADLLFGAKGLQGTLERFELRLAATGESVGELMRGINIELRVNDGQLTYGNVAGGRPVRLDLAALDISVPSGKPLIARARGALLEVPFEAHVRGGNLLTSLEEMRSPIDLQATGAGIRARIKGMVAQPQAKTGTDLQIEVTARRAGDLARWIGVAPSADAPIEVRGHALVERDEWHLRDFGLRLGRSSINGEFSRTGITATPLVSVRLDVPLIDLNELERLLPQTPRQAKPGGERAVIDIPVLPHKVDLWDADVQVDLHRIALQPADVTDVSFSGRIRDGKMWPSPFRATLAETVFQGATSIDLRGEVPEASVWVAASAVNLGRLLRTLKIAQDLEARADLVRVELIGRGSRLGEMLERSAFQAELEDGAITLRDANTRGKLDIRVVKGVAGAQPGKPVTLDLDGAYEAIPVKIQIASGALIEFLKTRDSVPFTLTAQAAGAKLDLTGSAALPISQRTVQLAMTLAGDRLSSLNPLVKVELPRWGPWVMRGQFRMGQGGYDVPNLELRVGQSSLGGRGSLTTTGARPRLDVALAAPRIQLDDFDLKGWSMLEKRPRKGDKPLTVEEMRSKAKETAAQGQKLLSPEVLRSMDANVDVEVKEVLSGKDRLGNGKLHAQLKDGRLELAPAEVSVPGGSARVALGYQPSATDVAVDARVDVRRFDYGILARRIKPDTDLEGLFSLQLQLQSRAPTLDAVMQHANGSIDFAVWPRNLKAGIFDLWAVNLLVALVPAVDPAAASRVNCAVGRFNIKDGKLAQDAIMLDTSRMRVSGEGNVDFGSETLYFRLKPSAKTPQFFSLATPVQVTGTLTDYKIGVRGSDVLDTTARLLSSVVVTPLQMLAGRRLPRDGADVCGADAIRERAAK